MAVKVDEKAINNGTGNGAKTGGSNIYDKTTGQYINSLTNPSYYDYVKQQATTGPMTTINAGIGASANNIKNPTSAVDLSYATNYVPKTSNTDNPNVTPQAVSNYSDNYINAVQNSLNAKNKILDDYLNRYISLMNTFGNKNQRQIDNRLKGGLSGAMLTDQLNNRLNVQNNIANAVSQANSDKLANVDNAISRVENLYNTAKDDDILGRLSSFYKNLRG